MTLCTTNFSTETKGNKLEIPIEFGLWREGGGLMGFIIVVLVACCLG